MLRSLQVSFIQPSRWIPKKIILPIPEKALSRALENPSITLVIPTYNRLDVWPNLLRSLASQTQLPDAIVVVDQSSKKAHDTLKKMCTKMVPNVEWDFIRLFTPNRCQAKDLGIHSVNEGIVVIIDDDLWLPKGFIDYYKSYLTEHQNHVLTTRIIEIDRPLLATNKVQRYTWYGHFFNNNYSLLEADTLISVTGACFGFVMKEDVKDVHFEPAFIGTGIMEEPDLSWQLLKAGRSIVYKPDVTVVHFPQRDGNDAAKKVNAVNWYADSFYNFGLYHAKHALGILHRLRKPYLYILAANVVFNRGFNGSFIKKLQKNKKFNDLINIDGIGETQTNSIKDFFSNKINLVVLNELAKILTINDYMVKKKGGLLNNKTFLVTGKLKGISRAEIKSLIEENSGTTVSSVSKKLNYLITGEKPTKRKVESAKELKITILDQGQFLKMLN